MDFSKDDLIEIFQCIENVTIVVEPAEIVEMFEECEDVEECKIYINSYM